MIQAMDKRVRHIILIGACTFTFGCSHSRRFTGTIVTPETTWSTEETGSYIRASTFKETKNHLLVVQSSNKEIGNWNVIVETNAQEPRAWIVLGKKKNNLFKEVAINASLHIQNVFQDAHELHGLISITNCNSNKKFNIVLNTTSKDTHWGVEGKFHATSSFRPEYVPGLLILTGAAVVNGVQRIIDPNTKPMPMP